MRRIRLSYCVRESLRGWWAVLVSMNQPKNVMTVFLMRERPNTVYYRRRRRNFLAAHARLLCRPSSRAFARPPPPALARVHGGAWRQKYGSGRRRMPSGVATIDHQRSEISRAAASSR